MTAYFDVATPPQEGRFAGHLDREGQLLGMIESCIVVVIPRDTHFDLLRLAPSRWWIVSRHCRVNSMRILRLTRANQYLSERATMRPEASSHHSAINDVTLPPVVRAQAG